MRWAIRNLYDRHFINGLTLEFDKVSDKVKRQSGKLLVLEKARLMNTPAAAIAWEIWRKNRLALSLIIALLPISFLLRAILWPEAVQMFEAFAVLATVVILFWVVSFTGMDER